MQSPSLMEVTEREPITHRTTRSGREPSLPRRYSSPAVVTRPEPARPAAVTEPAEDERSWLLAAMEERADAPRDPSAIAALVRDRLVSALHVGRVHPGDRLPSLREAASALGVTHHAVLKAYAALAEEGLVEARACSGTYVAEQDHLLERPLGETAEWLVDVLEQACAHQIRVPLLPDLLRRWTAAVPMRCACIASNEDERYALRAEAEQQFGLRASTLSPTQLPTHPAGPAPADALEADAWVTTALAAPRVQALADALSKPLVVAAMAPERVRAVKVHLKERPLTVVCVDPAFGEQLQRLFDATGERVRTVLAGDPAALSTIDPAESVFLTRAARDRVQSVRFRLLVTPSPAFCPSFARGLVTLLVRFNLGTGAAAE